MDPLELLKADVSAGDQAVVVASLTKLRMVAMAMGPERVVQELLPYLREVSETTESDEVQTHVGQQLGGFVSLVGGADQAYTLFPLLEYLASQDETVVRKSAVESMKKISETLPDKDILSKALPLLQRLADSEWWCARHSATLFLPTVYGLSPEDARLELRAMFTQLINDETPMVRKAAYSAVSVMSSHMEGQQVMADLVPLVQTLAQEELDELRAFAIEESAFIAAKLTEGEIDEHILPLFEALHVDPSWSVRFQIAKSIAVLCKNIPTKLSDERILPIFALLLRDPEPQVRLMATKLLPEVASAHSAGALKQHLTTVLTQLTTDTNERVRAAFSGSIIKLCPPFGTEAANATIVPLCQLLAKDILPEVRNNIIKNSKDMVEALGMDVALSVVLPTLLELSKDAKWRVRMEAIVQIAAIGKDLGVDVFEQRLQQVLLDALSDHVFAIRETAAREIRLLVNAFGVDWAVSRLFPEALAVYNKSTNYLHRITTLAIIENVVEDLSGDVIKKNLLNIVLGALEDEVANVRFSAVKIVAKVAHKLDEQTVSEEVRPVLAKLVSDADGDVVYFTTEALKALNSTS